MRGVMVLVVVVVVAGTTLGAHPPITVHAGGSPPIPRPAKGPVEDPAEEGERPPCKSPAGKSEENAEPSRNRLFDTYVVEHAISEPGARQAARLIDEADVQSYAIGCDECTESEIDYCSGSALIQDHCCCDGRYIESFPYVPHTCYRGPEICKPVKSDCEEYMRVRDCCCREHLSSKWKARFLANGAVKNGHRSKAVRWLWLLPWMLTIFLI